LYISKQGFITSENTQKQGKNDIDDKKCCGHSNITVKN